MENVTKMDFFGFERFHNFLNRALPGFSVRYTKKDGFGPLIEIASKGELDDYEVRLTIHHPLHKKIAYDNVDLEGSFEDDTFENPMLQMYFDVRNADVERVYIVETECFDRKGLIGALEKTIGQVPPIKRTLPDKEFCEKCEKWMDELMTSSGIVSYLI